MLVALAAGACGGRGSDDEGASGEAAPTADSAGTGAETAGGEVATADGSAGGASAASQEISLGVVPAGAAPAAPLGVGQRVVRTADLRVELRGSFAEGFDAASRLATSLGGFVAESSAVTEEDRLAGGTLTLRVPSDRFDDALSALAALGEVEQRTVKGEDVGGQLVDLEARLTSLRAQEEAVRTILSRATTIGDTIAVQDRLTQVRQQIEQLAGQQAKLADAVAFSTVRATLFEPGVGVQPDASEPAEDGLADRARQAVDAAVAVVGGLMLVAGALLPLVPLALLGWLSWRFAVRRRARPAAPAAS